MSISGVHGARCDAIVSSSPFAFQLHGNQLQSLPAEIGQFTNLQQLWVRWLIQCIPSLRVFTISCLSNRGC